MIERQKIAAILESNKEFNILEEIVAKYHDCQPVLVIDELSIYESTAFLI